MSDGRAPTTRPAPYRAACLQLQILGPVSTPAQGAAHRRAAIERLDAVIGAVRRPARQAPLRLVLVPEFWLCGGPGTETADAYRASAGVTVPGPLTDELGRLAVEHSCHIAANVIEVDGDETYDSAVLVGEDGTILLHYREIAAAAHGATMAAPPLAGQAETAGETRARIMPVADTPLGRIAIVVGSDIRYGTVPELAALQGTDVLLHLANEPELCRDVWKLSKAVRSREGRHYLLSCNNAGYFDPLVSVGQTSWGGSRVMAPTGQVLVETLAAGEAVVESVIDLALVDAVRARSGPCRANGPIATAAPTDVPPGAPAPVPHPGGRFLIDGDGDGDPRLELTWVLEASARPAAVLVRDRGEAGGGAERQVSLDGGGTQAHRIDPGDPREVTLIGLVPGRGTNPSSALARLRVGEGGDVVRGLVAAGARALVVVTDGPLRPEPADRLRDWARVVAWENEVPVLVVGDAIERPPATRVARELAHISPSGDLLEVTELDERDWRGLPVASTTDPALLAQAEQRRRVRKTLVDLVEACRQEEDESTKDRR